MDILDDMGMSKCFKVNYSFNTNFFLGLLHHNHSLLSPTAKSQVSLKTLI